MSKKPKRNTTKASGNGTRERGIGFYPVTIKTPEGKVKRVVPRETLSEEYWKEFWLNWGKRGQEDFGRSGKTNLPPGIRRKLQKIYPDIYPAGPDVTDETF